MTMRKATSIRAIVLIAGVSGLEFACRVGIIPRIIMVPPSRMLLSLIDLIRTGAITSDTLQTLTSVAIALSSSIVVGFVLGALFHALPRARRTIDPLLATYYSIPVFVFYPLFIALFGLNAVPKTVIGFLYAVVAMVISTLNGLDRVPSVLWKAARVHHLGKAPTLVFMVFPYAAAYFFTGVKLAVVYSFIGVIGSEFILSSGGLGYNISFAYYNFQNDVMYALILLVLAVVITINMTLYYWERRLMERRGGR